MTHFLNVAVYTLLLVNALWWGRRALTAVGVYRFSRAAVGEQQEHECADPNCPGAVLISAMADTHREVRADAFWAVLTFLVPLAAAVYVFGLLMGRLA